jgi:hypothetical protein
VSGKSHRKLPERATLSQALRVDIELSENLMILDQSWIAPLSEEPAADW